MPVVSEPHTELVGGGKNAKYINGEHIVCSSCYCNARVYPQNLARQTEIGLCMCFALPSKASTCTSTRDERLYLQHAHPKHFAWHMQAWIANQPLSSCASPCTCRTAVHWHMEHPSARTRQQAVTLTACPTRRTVWYPVSTLHTTIAGSSAGHLPMATCKLICISPRHTSKCACKRASTYPRKIRTHTCVYACTRVCNR